MGLSAPATAFLPGHRRRARLMRMESAAILKRFFFCETKNIGKKQKRAAAFASYGDAASQHDMDFDWADESIHASYGKRWLTALIAARGLPPETFGHVQDRCAGLVAAGAARATPAEVADIRAAADRLIAHARVLAASPASLTATDS